MIHPSKHRLRFLSFFCCLAYFSSYLTRINYTAVRLAIADDLSLTHPELVLELGIALSAASITYGLGQMISGILGDRLQPIALVGSGLGGAIACNLLMPALYPSVYWMALVWGINGFFQSLIRPPLGRIIAANFDEKGYIDTCVLVSNSSQVATVFTYVVIPLCLHRFHNNWRLAFYLPVAFCAVTLALWLLLVPKLCKRQSVHTTSSHIKDASRPAPLLALVMKSGLYIFIFPMLVHGLLRDGITAWMPDFIADVGKLGTNVSILTTAVLPLFCILSVIIAKRICSAIPSDGTSSALFFIVSTASAAIIVPLLEHVNPFTFVIIVLLMALITGCMHSVNHIFITRIPVAFKKAGRVSGVVGLLNATTYIGSALSPYAVALIAGKSGWSTAVLFWMLLAALSTALCIAARRKWDTYKNTH